MKINDYVPMLINRLIIEFAKNDQSGIYGEIQRHLAYNSNRIEGSNLSYNQVSILFATKTIVSDNKQLIRTKDVEEMNGHFVMFNNMLKTYNQELTEDLIKSYHYDLKIGVFEDKANGYPIGQYKNRGNRVSDIMTSSPEEVHQKMQELLSWYNKIKTPTIEDIAKFHAKYEAIHPFQDGNGRTGRIIMFKECLKNNTFPFIIEDAKKANYYECLHQAQNGSIKPLITFLEEEQQVYFNSIKDLICESSTNDNKE